MNSSYKIVFLGAFVLFAGVIGYVAFFSGTQAPDPAAQDAGDDAAQPDQTPEAGSPPPTRPGLDAASPPEPQREVTIGGPTFDDPLDDPLIDPLIDPVDEGEPTGSTPGASDRFADGTPGLSETGPGERLGPSIDDILLDDELAGSRGGERIGPGVARGTGDTGTTDDADTTGQPDTADEPDEPAPREPETEPAEPQRTTPRATPRTYEVQAGDTFASIAVAVFGDEKAWFDIAQANPSVDPKQLQVGQVIALPRLDAPDTEREEALPAPDADRSYTVRPGDNLSRIARRFYGDSDKWELIYARNRKAIGPRPDNLKVGMKLVIPQATDGAQ